MDNILTDTLSFTKAIQNAYTILKERTLAAAHAAEQVATNQETLRWAKARRLMTKVEGANEAQREANLRLMLEPQYLAVADSERIANATDCALKLAQMEVESLKMQLRVMELESQREAMTHWREEAYAADKWTNDFLAGSFTPKETVTQTEGVNEHGSN
jgi:hypothetical protein